MMERRNKIILIFLLTVEEHQRKENNNCKSSPFRLLVFSSAMLKLYYLVRLNLIPSGHFS